MSTNLDNVANNILAYMEEMKKLGKLSDQELVEKALVELDDTPLVAELLNRVLPDWFVEEEWPDVIDG